MMSRKWTEIISPKYMHDTLGVYQGTCMHTQPKTSSREQFSEDAQKIQQDLLKITNNMRKNTKM